MQGEHVPFSLKETEASYAGYFRFEFDEELKSLSTNCSVVKGRHFIILLSGDYKFCQWSHISLYLLNIT